MMMSNAPDTSKLEEYARNALLELSFEDGKMWTEVKLLRTEVAIVAYDGIPVFEARLMFDMGHHAHNYETHFSLIVAKLEKWNVHLEFPCVAFVSLNGPDWV
jgi:hypothetical protein